MFRPQTGEIMTDAEPEEVAEEAAECHLVPLCEHSAKSLSCDTARLILCLRLPFLSQILNS